MQAPTCVLQASPQGHARQLQTPAVAQVVSEVSFREAAAPATAVGLTPPALPRSVRDPIMDIKQIHTLMCPGPAVRCSVVFRCLACAGLISGEM